MVYWSQIYWRCLFLISFCLVQNGSMHQKDAVNDDDFDNYLSSQTNQVSFFDYAVILVVSNAL